MSNLITKVNLIEKFEGELFNLLEKTHKSGLSYYEILKLYLNILQKLILQVDAEEICGKYLFCKTKCDKGMRKLFIPDFAIEFKF